MRDDFSSLDRLASNGGWDNDRIRTAGEELYERQMAVVPTIIRQIDVAQAAIQEQDAIVDPSNPGQGSYGVDGTDWYGWSNLVGGGPDVNPALMGRAKFPIYREMKVSDAAIRSLSFMYKLPIRSGDVSVVPAVSDPDGDVVAKARADWVASIFGLERHNLPSLDLTFDQLLSMLLLYIDYGCMGAECQPGDICEWRDADGDSHWLRPLARIAPRMPASIDQIHVNANTGRLDSIRQDLPGAEKIPGERVVWMVAEREGDNWWGVSPLRAAWGPWTFKQVLLKIGVMAFDRFGLGIPVVRHPAGKHAQAEQFGRSLRAHERGYFAFEGPDPAAGGDWGIDIVNGASSIADPVQFLRYLDQQIAITGLQQFSSLGTTQTGNRAIGEVLVEPFYMAVQAVAAEVCTELMRTALGLLWKWNFAPGIPVPEITIGRIQGAHVSVLARALSDLSTAGLSFTDRDTQNDVRDLLDLRHIPDQVKPVVASGLTGLPNNIGVTALPTPAEGGSVVPAAA